MGSDAIRNKAGRPLAGAAGRLDRLGCAGARLERQRVDQEGPVLDGLEHAHVGNAAAGERGQRERALVGAGGNHGFEQQVAFVAGLDDRTDRTAVFEGRGQELAASTPRS
jgi:hypothetical protein